MSKYAEATIKLFNIKNRISGKTPNEKAELLNNLLKDETDPNITEADKIVNNEILKLLSNETGK